MHEISQLTFSSLHDKFKIVLFFNGEGQSRQRDKRVTCSALEPWISRNDIPLVILSAVMELMCCINKAMEEIVAWRAQAHLLVKKLAKRRCFRLTYGSGEHNALTFLYVHLKIARNIKVLVRGISSFLLFWILYPSVPVWLENKAVFL